VTNPERPGPAGIQLAGLVKNFRRPNGEPIHAVRGVDIAIAPGETVALLGPNGAGKSTTVDMMLGLSKPDAGHVSLFGGTPAQAIQRGQVGAMLQTGGVLRDLSVREIVAMMGALFPHPLLVDDVLALAGLSDIADQRTQKLSGGQSQRVRFAVAMVSDPDLLVLDEPTVAMDVEARNAFWATMRAFASQGKTVIFASHYLEEADAYADRIILMGPWPGRRRRCHHRDQVPGRRQDHPSYPARSLDGGPRRPAGSRRRRQPRRRGPAALQRVRPGHPRHGRRLPLGARHRDHRRWPGTGLPRAHQRRGRGRADRNRAPGSRSMNPTYFKYELVRLIRNKRFFFLSLAFPLLLFLVIGGTNKNATVDIGGFKVNFLVFYCVAMAGYGAMMASMAGGARIAAERSVGWNRQLRLTPLKPSQYFGGKVITAYLMAALSIVVLYAAGLTLGVHIDSVPDWLEMTGLILLCLAPFVGLGIYFGHVLSVDTMGPALGGTVALLALLGGMFSPLPASGTLHDIAELLPSYWLTQATYVGVGGPVWAAKGWIVVAVWTVGTVLLATNAYRRDTARV
jgi:ABC-2 type transport system permease protein